MQPLPTLLTLGLAVLCPALARGSMSGPAAEERRDFPPVSRATRLDLRRLCAELARLGDEAELEELLAILVELGDSPDELAPFLERWRRSLTTARPRPGRHESVAAELERTARVVAAELEGLEPEGRQALAAVILRLDAACEPAARAAGRVEHEGAWVEAAHLERLARRERVAELARRARRLEVEIEHDYDDRGPTLELFGEPVPSVSYGRRVYLRGPIEHHRLERMLRSALRGAALSNALLGGELAVPRVREHAFLLPNGAAAYDAALEEAYASRSMVDWEYEAHDELELESFIDLRGWRTCNRRQEADYQALVLMDLLVDWVPRNAQPTLVAGHLNWICLELFGTKMPLNAIPPEEPAAPAAVSETRADLSTAQRRRGLWRVAQTGLAGCRLWLVERVREGHNPPWARSMLDHVGKIVGEPLLKTTLVAEYLQERGELGSLLARTRGSHFGPRTYERALELPLEEFEARWVEWLLSEGAPPDPGIVQRLRGLAEAARETPEPVLVQELARIRLAAMGATPAEFPELGVYADLDRGAQAHADYLARHPDQLLRWPDAHEQYPDREGFSSAGARAGLRSVIWPGSEATALDAWMATFYHRLPLLDPGLVGVGLGRGPGVVVLDVSSLVLRPWREHWVAWPYDGARDVPLRFVPELPSPVPSEPHGSWGYPITLQVFQPLQRTELAIELRLWKGREGAREAVDCHAITPQAPKNPELAPAGAWCLIPRHPLQPGSTYTIEARVEGEVTPREWSFTTAE